MNSENTDKKITEEEIINAELIEAKETWEKAATYFYQGNSDKGMTLLEKSVEYALRFPELTEATNELLNAIENTDYIYAGDMLHFEMAERI